MARKHGFFRPHIAGMSGIASTTLTDRVSNAPDWIPAGASYFADFVNDRYWAGSVLTFSTATAFTRATEGYSDDLAGDFSLFASGAPRITDAGIRIEPASQRVNVWPKTLSNWTNISATVSAVAGTFLGVFTDARRVASAGATWHQIQLPAATAALTNGGTYEFTVIAKAGTSGKIDIEFVRTSDSATSNVTGTFGALAATASGAGTISGLAETSLGGGLVKITGILTANAASPYLIGLKPNTATSGQYVDLYAAWMETVGPSSPILATEGAATTRNADALVLKLPAGSAKDLVFTFDDDTTQTVAAVAGGDYAVPTNLNRPRVTSAVWGGL